MTQGNQTKNKRRIGVCQECLLAVFVRKDGTAWRHRMAFGAADQTCEGSGYQAFPRGYREAMEERYVG